MAVDKLVDSTQLDTDLTAVANAIRTKGGTSAQLAFPGGFVSAIQAITTGITPTGTKQISITENGTVTEDVTNYVSAEITVAVQGGDGYTAADWLDLTKPTGDIVTDVIEIWPYALYKRTGAITVTATIAAYVGDCAFGSNTGITKIFGKRIRGSGAYTFSGATNLEYVVFGDGLVAYSSSFSGCSKLKAVDFGGSPTTSQGFLRTNAFDGATVFKTLVLRGNTVWPLSNINNFANSPFASGKSGGTLYVPQALIADYQAATNWSTILGYANNQILPIEGSVYETQYVDGTPIAA